MSNISRRQLLAGGASAAATLAFAGSVRGRELAQQTINQAASMQPAGSDIGAVQHVIFLMMENRSFDHYFGRMGGVRGFDDHPANNLGAFAQPWPRGKKPTLLPFHLNPRTQKAECTYDLSHTWPTQHVCWDYGKMDRFVSTHSSGFLEGNRYGPTTMGYYEQEDIPFHYALAEQFTICDNYHCSVLGPTHPNRLFHMTGTNDPDGLAGGPILSTNESQLLQFSCSWTTMPERLSANNVSWKVYNPVGPTYQPGSGLALLINNNALLYFKQFQNPASTLYQNAFGYVGPNTNTVLPGPPTGPNDFGHDVMTGQLPKVSWIMPPLGFDEHPPAPPVFGAWYIQQVLETLLANPSVWASTVLFISYDENDGFFDHVSPPTAPLGTPGEYVTVNPLPADSGGIAGPIGLGVRVPMLVVSPFSTGGYVCSDVFDHTSQLRFLETLLGITVPNLSSWRRSVTGDLTAALPHSTQAVTTPPVLPAVSTNLNRRPLSECMPGQLLENNSAMKPYKIPQVKHQVMPTQAPGTLIPTPS